ERAAALELAREEAGNVVARCVQHRPRLRLERLDDHSPRRLTAAPAGELREELERSLLRAEVRQSEPGVGIDDRRELDAREVGALGHHLGSDEDGALGARKAFGTRAQTLR